MAEGDISFYLNFQYGLWKKLYDCENDSFAVILVTGHTLDLINDSDYTDVSADEYPDITGGYTAGGEIVPNPTVTKDTANSRILFNADDVTWTALGPLSPATPSHAIVYHVSTGDLVCAMVLGSTATTGADYTIQWSNSPAGIGKSE